MAVPLGHMAKSAVKKNPSKKMSSPKSGKSALKESSAPYSTVTKTIQYLGGHSSVLGGIRIDEENDFITLIKKGLPRKALDQLMLFTGLTGIEISRIMHTSDRTLRRYKPSTLLNPEQSERVIEIARLYSRGDDVLGSVENFKTWMDSSIPSLGNRIPKEFLDTSMGIEMLMDTLGRIEHGVFA